MSKVTPISAAYKNAKPKEPEWPNPIPLPESLPDVPAFDANLLPTQLQAWTEDISERLNVPLDFCAIPAMVAAGSLIGAKVGVRPQAKTSWTEASNLWGCIVGSPGMMKSPAVGEVLAPLRRLDARADREFQAELSSYEDSSIVQKMALEEAQKSARKAIRDGNCDVAQDIIASVARNDPPAAKRYLLTDATVEKMGEICAENPDGILFYRDELLTQFIDLESPEKAVARGFFLTGWNGQDFYVFDRIMRGTIRIPRVNLSVFGTSQPNRIASYVQRSLNDKNDGMVQRIQLMSWPDVTEEWRNVDRQPHIASKESAFACYEQLAALTSNRADFARDAFDDGEGMAFLRFDPEAVERFIEYRGWLEGAVRSDELPAGMAEHLSKFRGLVPRLALIDHLASGGEGHVSDHSVEKAIAWSRYLEGHARRVYGSLSIDSGDIAKAIWKRVERGDLEAEFTERDIYSRHWTKLGKGERLSKALKMLVDYDWLVAEQKATGGRPTTIYKINPKALEVQHLAA